MVVLPGCTTVHDIYIPWHSIILDAVPWFYLALPLYSTYTKHWLFLALLYSSKFNHGSHWLSTLRSSGDWPLRHDVFYALRDWNWWLSWDATLSWLLRHSMLLSGNCMLTFDFWAKLWECVTRPLSCNNPAEVELIFQNGVQSLNCILYIKFTKVSAHWCTNTTIA